MNLVSKLLVVLAFTATALSAQVTIPALPLNPPAAHPSGVTFNVTVTDRAGRPVTGLSEADFHLTDNGSPAPIQAFVAHSAANAPLSAFIVCDVDPLGLWDAGSFRTSLWRAFAKPVPRWTKAQPGDLALQVIVDHRGGLRAPDADASPVLRSGR